MEQWIQILVFGNTEDNTGRFWFNKQEKRMFYYDGTTWTSYETSFGRTLTVDSIRIRENGNNTAPLLLNINAPLLLTNIDNNGNLSSIPEPPGPRGGIF